MQQELEKITDKILSSRKYRSLYRPVVERTVKTCLEKYKAEEVEEKSRNLLHQTWGAFLVGQPNWPKLRKKLEAGLSEGLEKKELVKGILIEHNSTEERLPCLDEFYERIFRITGIPESIADYGCGLNPLTLPWMNLTRNTKYEAYDIDCGEVDFLNQALSLLGWNGIAKVQPGDLLSNSTASAEMGLYLKILPVLEHLEHGISLKILKESPTKWQAVSFPVASLSGREKGMVDFYSLRFESWLNSEKYNWQRLDFPTELVYVVHK